MPNKQILLVLNVLTIGVLEQLSTGSAPLEYIIEDGRIVGYQHREVEPCQP